MFLECQLNYLLWLQNFRELSGGVFDQFFITITQCAEIIIPIIFVAVFYWCINRRFGEFILVTYSFGLIISQFLKYIFCIERPWILSDKIKPVQKALKMAAGYSFPSGHTQCAMSVWGGIATLFWKNKIIRYSMIILIALIAFSRNYLGVHTPQDVIVAIICGIIILTMVKKVFDNIDTHRNLDLKVFIFTIGLVLLAWVSIWLKMVVLASPEGLEEKNISLPGYYAALSNSLGITLGWFLARKFVNFSTDVSILTKISRAVLGIAGIFGLFACKEFLVTHLGKTLGLITDFSSIALFITFIYPLIFSWVENKLKIKNSSY